MNDGVRHFFPGGNTSEGFFSYYDYILPQNEANRIITIKGGPGTGKSSMMMKIGDYFNSKGYNVEFHHCSSDNNSLDAVVIPYLKTAMLDGTSPHVVDPKNPGAVDEVLNLCEYWDTKSLERNKDSIINVNKNISNTFKRAYKYINAAKLIEDSWYKLNLEALDISKINLLKENLKNEILKNNIGTIGKERHLFATAFTPKGIVTYINNLCENCQKVYVLNGEPGTLKSDILEYLKNEAIKRGHLVEILHKPLIPKEIEHIIIPDLSTAIITSNEINQKQFKGKQINMNEFQKETILCNNSKKIMEEKEYFHMILNKGLEIISTAKKLHDELETYYIPAMDFKKLDEVYAKVLDKFLSYENATKERNAFKNEPSDLFFI
ncbi:PRK06851 family protein [Haloimpatiens sp. FM7315]|uniref:PRK06851 family protein n=1 Tax=Haloimpatiens sp. FM7315 TaxID=3298609 RepID=UPI00370C2859